MERVLISLPEQLVSRLRAAIPARKRSQVIRDLIEKEVKLRERSLYECALAVEKDKQLNKEMADWDITLEDGLKEL